MVAWRQIGVESMSERTTNSFRDWLCVYLYSNYIYIYIYKYAYVCNVYVYICMYRYMYMYVCMCIYIYVSMCMCVYVCIYIYVCLQVIFISQENQIHVLCYSAILEDLCIVYHSYILCALVHLSWYLRLNLMILAPEVLRYGLTSLNKTHWITWVKKESFTEVRSNRCL